MADNAVNLTGVEILRVGIWNNVPLAREDLAGMVDAFNETGEALPVDVRLGHSARQAFARAVFGAMGGNTADDAAADEGGWPALGWVTALRLDGDRLVADLSDVPPRVADWIKSKRYRTRSIGLKFNVHVKFNKRVGEKVYRWMVDHLALLGGDTPAVSGLQDIGLSGGDEGRMVVFGAVDMAGDAGDAQTALDQLVAALSAAMDEHTPLVYGRKGAPMVRQLFAAFLAKLRESARPDLPLSDLEGHMPTRLDMADVRALVNLTDTDPAIRVAEALNTLDDEGAMRLVNMADGMAFESADQLVGWLAGALALPPGDLAGIASKVVELMGGDAPAMPDAAMPPDAGAAPADGGTGMSDKTPAAVPGDAALAARVVELSERNVEMAARLVALETANKHAGAVAKVAADAKQRGLDLPKPVEDTLIELAEAGNTKAYDAIIANVRTVPAGDKGASSAHPLADVELSETEARIATEHGVSLDDYRRQKAAAMGIKIAGAA